MVDRYLEYGADTEMSDGGKAMITAIIFHKSCICETIHKQGVEGTCSRCIALDYIKKHWPWWYFTTVGNMGATDEL